MSDAVTSTPLTSAGLFSDRFNRVSVWAVGDIIMNPCRVLLVGVCLFISIIANAHNLGAAEPKVQIVSPKDGSRITQDQNAIFVSGKVVRDTGRSANVDIFLVIDISGSTAMYGGAELGDADQPPESSGFGTPQITIGGMSLGKPPMRNPRNSILAAEVAAARRLLLQLNGESTRVGVLTFSEGAKLVQPLTHGFPSLPIGGGKRMTPEDINLTINAARLAGKAGIKVHVFALGEEALSYPTAAVGIAKESGGTYTPLLRPADALAVLENISVVGVDYIQVVNQTSGQKATQLRLAADGFFSSALPVVEGRNQIEVVARASDGSNGRDSVTVYYQTGTQKSLELEVFLEKERKLKLEVERLGRSPAEIQREVERNREDSLRRPQQLPPPTEGPPR